MHGAIRIGVVALALAAGSAMAAPAGDEDVDALVAHLILDQSYVTRGTSEIPLETRLAALGEFALPALERELHLDLKGQEAQRFIDSGKSRRYSVIRVLGRIEGARSTDLLIATVRAYGDFNGLCDAVVHELKPRALTGSELGLLLRSASPSGILFALGKAGPIGADSPLRTAVEDLFDRDRARLQLRNGNGAVIGGEETLWEIRLAAGRALGKDMVPQMRDRATAIVGDLLGIPARGWTGTRNYFPPSNLTGAEIEVEGAILRLVVLGAPAREVVVKARDSAVGDAASVLDMALLALGDGERVMAVAGMLNDSPNGSLRLCAARVLARTKDPRARDAWWKAMHDPLCRRFIGCIPVPGRTEVYPVREIAASALVGLGEPSDVVRERLRPTASGVPASPGISASSVWTRAGILVIAALLVLWIWSVGRRKVRLNAT